MRRLHLWKHPVLDERAITLDGHHATFRTDFLDRFPDGLEPAYFCTNHPYLHGRGMVDNDGTVTKPNSLLGALYAGLVYPGKGLAVAKREYKYEHYIKQVTEQGIDELDLRLTLPNSDQLNPFFYVPRFYVTISPHWTSTIPEELEPETTGLLMGFLKWFIPRGWQGDSDVHTVTVYGTKPEKAYVKAGELYKKWQEDLESRGFTVHADHEIPRGLTDRLDEEELPPT